MANQPWRWQQTWRFLGLSTVLERTGQQCVILGCTSPLAAAVRQSPCGSSQHVLPHQFQSTHSILSASGA